MNDLIRRSALLKKLERPENCIPGYCCNACGEIAEAPSVDAVEVTRCKDCRASEPCKPERKSYLWCNVWDYIVPANGYCFHAEKIGAKDTNVPTKDGGAEG